jgi:hypothetical protein
MTRLQKVVGITIIASVAIVDIGLMADSAKHFLPARLSPLNLMQIVVLILASFIVWLIKDKKDEQKKETIPESVVPKAEQKTEIKNEANPSISVPVSVSVNTAHPDPPMLKFPEQPKIRKRRPNIKVVHRKVTTINEPFPGDLVEKDGKGDGFYKGFIVVFRNEKSGSEDFDVIDWHSVRARIRFVDEHGQEQQHTKSATFIDESSWETNLNLFEVHKLLVAMKLPNGKWLAAENGEPVNLPTIPLKAEITLYGLAEYIFSAELNMDLENEVLVSESSSDTQSQVRETDPRIYVSLKKCGEVENHPLESRLVLSNVGKEPAHNISVEDLKFRVGTVTFDGPIGLIAGNGNEAVVPRSTAFGPAFNRDIVRVLEKEFGTYGDQIEREKITVPLTVTYSDYRGTRFETTCDLVFNGIANALKNLVTDRQVELAPAKRTP